MQDILYLKQNWNEPMEMLKSSRVLIILTLTVSDKESSNNNNPGGLSSILIKGKPSINFLLNSVKNCFSGLPDILYFTGSNVL